MLPGLPALLLTEVPAAAVAAAIHAPQAAVAAVTPVHPAAAIQAVVPAPAVLQAATVAAVQVHLAVHPAEVAVEDVSLPFCKCLLLSNFT